MDTLECSIRAGGSEEGEDDKDRCHPCVAQLSWHRERAVWVVPAPEGLRGMHEVRGRNAPLTSKPSLDTGKR